MNTKQFKKVMLAAAVVLLVPFIAMQFSDEVTWEVGDFIAAWIVLVGFGSGITLAIDKSGGRARRLLGAILAIGLAVLWVGLATGF